MENGGMNNQIKMHFPPHPDEVEKTSTMPAGPENGNGNGSKKAELLRGSLFPLMQEFFHGRNRPFNLEKTCASYKQAHDEYEKEVVLKDKNPNYVKTPWLTLMGNHRPDVFTQDEWLKFVSKYRDQLTRIIGEHTKLKNSDTQL